MNDPDRDWLDGVFEIFSSDDEGGRTLFEDLEDSALTLADEFLKSRTSRAKSYYRGLARDYLNFARKYVSAFEALGDDPLIVWSAKNGTCGSGKIERLAEKKENLRNTIQAVERMLRKSPTRAQREEVQSALSLKRRRRHDQNVEVRRIFDEVASFVESKSRPAR